MFTTERFFARIWCFWLLTVIVSVLSFAVGPKFIGFALTAGSVVVFFWCIKCAYRSERFSDYASLRLCFSLSAGPMFTFLAILAMTYSQRGLGWEISLAISLVPVILTYSAYGLVYASKIKPDAFVFVNKKVEVREAKQPNPWFLAGIGAGLSGVIYPFVQYYSGLMECFVAFFMFVSLYMVFYHRSRITSLRFLKECEAREQCGYAFVDIQYVRELRQASFLGRRFAPKNKN